MAYVKQNKQKQLLWSYLTLNCFWELWENFQGRNENLFMPEREFILLSWLYSQQPSHHVELWQLASWFWRVQSASFHTGKDFPCEEEQVRLVAFLGFGYKVVITSLLWTGFPLQKCCLHLAFSWVLVRWVSPIDIIVPISETEREHDGLKASGPVPWAGTAAKAPLMRGFCKCHLVGL